MDKSGREKEVKFYVLDLAQVEARLQDLGAEVVQPRVHEYNLRFDTPDRELTRGYRALRLRKDLDARITYKGPSETIEGVRSRQEIEFVVADFTAARDLFEVLGYQVSVIYEKYRATYLFKGVLVTLDEMPFGDFIEIEGPGGEEIRAVADQLGLDWGARNLESYLILFAHARTTLGFQFRDLVFENFAGLSVPPAALGVRPADVVGA